MGARILVVEDNQQNLELMSYLLTAYGHAVTTTARGEEAVPLARQDRPDLVVMDIQLVGGIDGYQALAELRADPDLAGLPVVAVTAFAMVGDRDRALAAGFTDYVTKPIDAPSFVGTIEVSLPAALRGHRPTQHVRPTVAPDRGHSPTVVATILVVDDQLTNVSVIRSLLEPHGYRVTEATSIDEAVWSAEHDPPGLVLSDIHIRNELGFELRRRLQAVPALAGIPFAFTTATGQLHAPELAAEPAEIIHRPINPDEFLARVAALTRSTARA
ncbi:MAG TPA: response regulator [Mycobacteriales bacterium]|nr:response regulator [Mycobacteriales bacterium]